LIFRTLRYVATFIFARGSHFLIPLLLANALPASVYGQLEFAQAVGAFGAIVLGMGLHSTIPLLVINGTDTARWDTLLLYFILISAVLTIGIFTVLGSFQTPLLYALPMLGVFVLLLQTLWSVTAKSKKSVEISLFLDTGFWICAIAALVIVFGFSIEVSGYLLWFFAILLTYGLCLLGWTWCKYSSVRQPVKRMDILQNLKLGVPFMLAGLLALMVTTSGRLLLGILSDAEMLGVYAVLFRATSIPIVGHQIITVAMFRNLYRWPFDILQKRTAVIPVMVIIAAITFWILVDKFGYILGARFAQVFSEHRTEGLLILTQTILWSAIALNDMINIRTQIAVNVIRANIPYVIAAYTLSGIFLWSQAELTLAVFVATHSCLMLGYYLVQCNTMHRLGVNIYLVWSLSAGSFCALTAIALFS